MRARWFASHVAALLAAMARVAFAQSTNDGSCVVIHELTAPAPLLERGSCSTRLSPASTFKIPHALVALDTGVVSADTIETWDGTKHPRQPEWDRTTRLPPRSGKPTAR